MTPKRPSQISIFVVGPSSTGKTTLCDALAKRLGLEASAYVKEVARGVIRRQGYTRADIASLEMQKAIMDAQIEREGEMGDCYAVRLFDRSAVDPIVYAVLTSETGQEAHRRRAVLLQSSKFRSALERYRESTFILLAPVAEWLVDDGIRHMEDQAKCFETYKAILADLEIPYYILDRSTKYLEERVVVAMGRARL